MLDIGWQELFLVAVVTLIIVGPKDLPTVLRTVARGVGKMRQLSSEFQSGLAEIVRDAELDDLKRKAETIARTDVAGTVKKTVDPTGTLTADFDPEEFNRRLKERVEAGPPEGPMSQHENAAANSASEPPSMAPRADDADKPDGKKGRHSPDATSHDAQ